MDSAVSEICDTGSIQGSTEEHSGGTIYLDINCVCLEPDNTRTRVTWHACIFNMDAVISPLPFCRFCIVNICIYIGCAVVYTV